MKHKPEYLRLRDLLPILFTLMPVRAMAEQSDAELVEKSLNPLALTQDMNPIIRTIIPLIDAEATPPGGDDKRGLGDTTQSFFLTPKDKIGGWIVGFGPVLLYPTAREDTLGNKKWGAGPAGVMVWQESGFTYGLLFNHIWSPAGNDSRPDVSATFLQPFFSYTTKTSTTLSLNAESTYDGEASQWTMPINIAVTQMVRIKGLPLSLQLGYRYYAEAPDYGPDWGGASQRPSAFPNDARGRVEQSE